MRGIGLAALSDNTKTIQMHIVKLHFFVKKIVYV
jgi:hypothetical protein